MVGVILPMWLVETLPIFPVSLRNHGTGLSLRDGGLLYYLHNDIGHEYTGLRQVTGPRN